MGKRAAAGGGASAKRQRHCEPRAEKARAAPKPKRASAKRQRHCEPRAEKVQAAPKKKGDVCLPHSEVVLDMLPDVDEALPTLLAEEAPVDTCDKEEAASPIAAAMAKASLSMSCVTSAYHLRASLSLGRAIICCATFVRDF